MVVDRWNYEETRIRKRANSNILKSKRLSVLRKTVILRCVFLLPKKQAKICAIYEVDAVDADRSIV